MKDGQPGTRNATDARFQRPGAGAHIRELPPSKYCTTEGRQPKFGAPEAPTPWGNSARPLRSRAVGQKRERPPPGRTPTNKSAPQLERHLACTAVWEGGPTFSPSGLAARQTNKVRLEPLSVFHQPLQPLRHQVLCRLAQPAAERLLCRRGWKRGQGGAGMRVVKDGAGMRGHYEGQKKAEPFRTCVTCAPRRVRPAYTTCCHAAGPTPPSPPAQPTMTDAPLSPQAPPPPPPPVAPPSYNPHPTPPPPPTRDGRQLIRGKVRVLGPRRREPRLHRVLHARRCAEAVIVALQRGAAPQRLQHPGPDHQVVAPRQRQRLCEEVQVGGGWVIVLLFCLFAF